jgi:AcrR family transcriptional regulator
MSEPEAVPESKEDPRVVRTKRDLSDALVELLEEKSFGEIAVKDICDRALISKNTFYNNFDSKEDLLAYCFGQVEQHLLDGLKPVLERFPYTPKKIFLHKVVESVVHWFYETTFPVAQMVKADKTHSLYYFLTEFCLSLYDRIKGLGDSLLSRKATSPIGREFYCGGLMTILYRESQNPDHLPEEKLSKEISRLLDTSLGLPF